MLVVDDAFKQLYGLYSSLPTDAKMLGEFLAHRRTTIKLFVDTLTEQILGNVLKRTFRNTLEARAFINNALASGNAPEEAILRSLEDVLQSYDVFRKDPYIDYSKPLTDVVDDRLRKLCELLVIHPAQASGAWARKLKSAL